MHCSKLEIVNGFHGKDALQCCWLIQFTVMCIGFACIHRRVCDDGRPTIVRCVISSIIRNERTNRTEQMKWNFCGWRTGKKPMHIISVPLSSFCNCVSIILWNMVYVGMPCMLSTHWSVHTDRMQYELISTSTHLTQMQPIDHDLFLFHLRFKLGKMLRWLPHFFLSLALIRNRLKLISPS